MSDEQVFYQIEFRGNHGMLSSKDSDDEFIAREIFDQAQFTGQCHCIELWEYKYDVPSPDYSYLLDSKELEMQTGTVMSAYWNAGKTTQRTWVRTPDGHEYLTTQKPRQIDRVPEIGSTVRFGKTDEYRIFKVID